MSLAASPFDVRRNRHRNSRFALLGFALLALMCLQISGLHFHSHLDADDGGSVVEMAEQGPHVGDHADDIDVDWPVDTLAPTPVHFTPELLPLVFAVAALVLPLPRRGADYDRRPRNDQYRPPPRFARPQGRAPPTIASIRI